MRFKSGQANQTYGLISEMDQSPKRYNASLKYHTARYLSFGMTPWEGSKKLAKPVQHDYYMNEQISVYLFSYVQKSELSNKEVINGLNSLG